MSVLLLMTKFKFGLFTLNRHLTSNKIETQIFENWVSKALKYFLMIQAFKNLQKCDFSITMTKSELEKMSHKEIKELLKF